MLALSPEERQSHQALIGRLFGKLVLEARELADGYAYRFAGEHYQLVAEFITHERLCCPFLTFGLTVAPERGWCVASASSSRDYHHMHEFVVCIMRNPHSKHLACRRWCVAPYHIWSI
jgi:hypothetical protein